MKTKTQKHTSERDIPGKMRYHVYKSFDTKTKILVASYGTRNEARRLEKVLLNTEFRDWQPEIWTELLD